MIRTDSWQSQTIKELQALLVSSEGVLALALFGSALKTDKQFDIWSDLDCLLVVAEDAFPQYYPGTEWLGPLGTLFSYQQSENLFHGTTRACFSDFRRLDFVITTPPKLEQLPDWPHIPFCQGACLLFSHSNHATQLLSQAWPAPRPTHPTPAQFEEMVNNFWFKAMLAGYKVVRDDRLIALHLALDLVRDCCVIGMILRDRTEKTNIHRHGGMGNDLVAKLENVGSNYSARGILNIIEQSAIQFDQLAAQWSAACDERRFPLIEWLEHIKNTINSG